MKWNGFSLLFEATAEHSLLSKDAKNEIFINRLTAIIDNAHVFLAVLSLSITYHHQGGHLLAIILDQFPVYFSHCYDCTAMFVGSPTLSYCSFIFF
jgi:hypothetical protein